MSNQVVGATFEQSSGAVKRTAPTGVTALYKPFWGFLAATFIWGAWTLLAQVTVGPAYVLLFMPVIPLMLVYTMIVQTLLNAFHIYTAPVWGFRIERLTLGPVELYRDGRRQTGLVNAWRAVGDAEIVVPASRSQELRSVGFLLCDAMLLLGLGLLGVLGRMGMLAVGISPIIVDIFPVAFVQSIVAIIGAMVFVLSVELFREHFMRKKSTGIWACHVVYAQSPPMAMLDSNGARPRDWATEIVLAQANTRSRSSAREVTEGLVRAYYHFLDAGDIQRAGTYIDQAAAYLGPFRRMAHPRIYPEIAYYLAFHKRNPVAARIRLKQRHDVDACPQVVLRAEAAIALAEGQAAEAAAKAREALALVDEHSPAGMALAEGEWLATLVERAVTAQEHHADEGAPL